MTEASSKHLASLAGLVLLAGLLLGLGVIFLGGDPEPGLTGVALDRTEAAQPRASFEVELETPWVEVSESAPASLAVEPPEEEEPSSTEETTKKTEEEITPEPPERELFGRVVDTAGDPCGGWEIALLDPSAEAREWKGWEVNHLPVTRDDGSFHFSGLKRERTYRLRTWNQATLQSFLSEPLPANVGNYIFVIDRSSVFADVYGQVVGLDGRPLEGVRIRLTMYERLREEAGELTDIENHTGQELRTDASGRFHFTEVPHQDVFLRFHGAEVAAQPYWFRPDSPVENLRIELKRQGRFDIDCDPELAPDALEVWDSGGALVAVKTSGAYDEPNRVSLSASSGDWPSYRTTDDAQLLVLFRDGREVARHPLALEPGATVTVVLD